MSESVALPVPSETSTKESTTSATLTTEIPGTIPSPKMNYRPPKRDAAAELDRKKRAKKIRKTRRPVQCVSIEEIRQASQRHGEKTEQPKDSKDSNKSAQHRCLSTIPETEMDDNTSIKDESSSKANIDTSRNNNLDIFSSESPFKRSGDTREAESEKDDYTSIEYRSSGNTNNDSSLRISLASSSCDSSLERPGDAREGDGWKNDDLSSDVQRSGNLQDAGPSSSILCSSHSPAQRLEETDSKAFAKKEPTQDYHKSKCNQEKVVEDNFKTYRGYIESCVKGSDLIAFYPKFTTEQQEQLRQQHRSDHRKATLLALDFIMEMKDEPDKFTCLIQALNDAEYPKVVGILTGQLKHVNKENRLKCKTSLPHVYKMLSTREVLPYLYARNVINADDKDEIETVLNKDGRASAAIDLLLMMPNRIREWFRIFIESLVACGQEELAELIDIKIFEEIQQRPSQEQNLEYDKLSTVTASSDDSLECRSEADSLDVTMDVQATCASNEDLTQNPSRYSSLESLIIEIEPEHIGARMLYDQSRDLTVNCFKLLKYRKNNLCFQETSNLHSIELMGETIAHYNKRLKQLMTKQRLEIFT